MERSLQMPAGRYNAIMARAVNYVLDYLERRFGIERKVFSQYVISGDEKWLFITSRPAADFAQLRAVRRGLKFALVYRDLVKLSTAAVQIFGRHASKNVLELDCDQMRRFVSGGTIEIAYDPADVEEGPVIVKHQGWPIGLGIYRAGRVKSQIPREKRIQKLLADPERFG